ncbi:hypothetical protein F4818DRAFT_436629 [Hypoxylon cercidicola]|nr:hypothetical protein F4818DRAFT_436629 [Hypoxylon cercidicola]
MSTPNKKTALITGCSDGGLGPRWPRFFSRKASTCLRRCEIRPRQAGTLADLSDVEILELDVAFEESVEFFDGNFWGVLVVTQAFAPMVIKVKGVVVNHASVVWNLAIAWGGIYNTSKAAVKQLSEVLRVELETLGVRVVTVLIGAVDTTMFANSTWETFEAPLGSYHEPIGSLS